MFSQVFGDPDDSSNEANIISAVEFNGDGNCLACGDHGGNITIYKRSDGRSNVRENHCQVCDDNGYVQASSQDNSSAPSSWDIYHQFQSHQQEFDYLKSLEIEEKINHIQWCRPLGDSSYMFTTNDKTIKLWKVGDRPVLGTSQRCASVRDGVLSMRRNQSSDLTTRATMRRSYCNAHAYHINSVSSNSDGETFLSADDLRINWWNTEINTSSFNIVDIKPPNMEELTEVITSAEFHPHHCNIVMYSSSRGSIKLGDTRQAALCDNYAKVLEEPEDASSKSFFSEIVASISDASFASDGRYIISRDYLTLKVWDTHMESSPVQTISINDGLKSMLCELYESDCIFDKFEIDLSPDGSRVLTGNYGNQFSVWNKQGFAEHNLSLTHAPSRGAGVMGSRSQLPRDPTSAEFDKKVLHCAWNPDGKTVALAAQSALFLYKV